MMNLKSRTINKEEKETEETKEIEKTEEIEETNKLNDSELERNSKGEIFEKIYNVINKLLFIVFKAIVFLCKASSMYFLWICLHYFSSHLYIKFCVPNTLLGFVMSPFLISTPHCQGLRWIVYNAANIINNMWIIIGSWIYSLIWILNTEQSRQYANNS